MNASNPKKGKSQRGQLVYMIAFRINLINYIIIHLLFATELLGIFWGFLTEGSLGIKYLH